MISGHRRPGPREALTNAVGARGPRVARVSGMSRRPAAAAISITAGSIVEQPQTASIGVENRVVDSRSADRAAGRMNEGVDGAGAAVGEGDYRQLGVS